MVERTRSEEAQNDMSNGGHSIFRTGLIFAKSALLLKG